MMFKFIIINVHRYGRVIKLYLHKCGGRKLKTCTAQTDFSDNLFMKPKSAMHEDMELNPSANAYEKLLNQPRKLRKLSD